MTNTMKLKVGKESIKLIGLIGELQGETVSYGSMVSHILIVVHTRILINNCRKVRSIKGGNLAGPIPFSSDGTKPFSIAFSRKMVTSGEWQQWA